MAESPWEAHVVYLEEEIRKLDDRAQRLEKMIPDMTTEQKRHALRELTNRLRDEASEHRKYISLVKPK
jgi:hypothetical protein